jgi:hypothetical protein
MDAANMKACNAKSGATAVLRIVRARSPDSRKVFAGAALHARLARRSVAQGYSCPVGSGIFLGDSAMPIFVDRPAENHPLSSAFDPRLACA